jgi:hypothetical protein
VRGGGRGDVLAELLDLLNLAGKLGGEGLLERLRWVSAKMSGAQRGCTAVEMMKRAERTDLGLASRVAAEAVEGGCAQGSSSAESALAQTESGSHCGRWDVEGADGGEGAGAGARGLKGCERWEKISVEQPLIKQEAQTIGRMRDCAGNEHDHASGLRHGPSIPGLSGRAGGAVPVALAPIWCARCASRQCLGTVPS